MTDGKPKQRHVDLPDSFLSCQICDKPRVLKTQTIQLTLHPDKIAFTSSQFARIQQINHKIKMLTQQLEADECNIEQNIMTIEQEIDELQSQLEQARQEAHARKIEFNDHWQNGGESFDDIRQVRAEINDLMRKREMIFLRLKQIEDQKTIYATKLEESHKRFGIKSIDEGISRIDQIDTQIQRETLTNGQLRRLLSDQERIRSGIKFLENITPSLTNEGSIFIEERDLHEELRNLCRTLCELREQRKVISDECDEISAITRTLRNEMKKSRKRVFDLERKLDDKIEQRLCLRSGQKINKRAAQRIQEEIESLEDEKMRISAEAETTTLKVKNERRKLKAARVLIEYMNNLEINESQGKKSKDAEIMTLISTLRQGSKKRKYSGRTKESVRSEQLIHDLNKLKMFEIVEIVPPKTIHEISATIEILQQKLREWTDVDDRSESSLDITQIQSLISPSS